MRTCALGLRQGFIINLDSSRTSLGSKVNTVTCLPIQQIFCFPLEEVSDAENESWKQLSFLFFYSIIFIQSTAR